MQANFQDVQTLVEQLTLVDKAQLLDTLASSVAQAISDDERFAEGKVKMTTEAEPDMTAKTLSLYVKVGDRFNCKMLDENREKIGYYDGYVPDFFPGEHYGDYLALDIDIKTGQITNWKQPRNLDIERIMGPI